MKENRGFSGIFTVLVAGAIFLAGAIFYSYPGHAMTKTETPSQKIEAGGNHAFKFYAEKFRVTSEQSLDNAVTGTNVSIKVRGLNPPFTVRPSNSLLSVNQTRTEDPRALKINANDDDTWPGAVFQVKFLEAGQSQLIIEDSKGNRSTIQITVKANSTFKM